MLKHFIMPFLLVLAMLGMGVSPLPSDSTAEQGKKAIIVKLEEMVDPGMAAYTKRAIQEAAAQKPDLIIFEVNTFGGELMAAFDIVDEITALQVPTVALVNKKAISAGALISLACNSLYMKPTTTIGDAAPITQGGEGGMTVLGEKIQSPLRAKFRNLAQRNGYPELLSQAMVTAELEIVQIVKGDSSRFLLKAEWGELTEAEKKGWSAPKTVVREGELLTMTNSEAQNWGFSSGTVQNMDELLQLLNVTAPEEVTISWAEKLAKFLRQITPFLMLLGFGALYMEFQTPGFGVFGFTGIVLLGAAFGGQAVVHLTGQLPVVLLVIGMLLIVIEILVLPGTMLSGLTGGALMGAALILVMKEASLPWQSFGQTGGIKQAMGLVVGTAFVALLFPVLAFRFVLPNLPQRFSIIQKETLASAVAPMVDAESQLQVGLIGEALTDLKLSGKGRFNGVMVEVQSRDKYISKGAAIQIIDRHGNFFTVVESDNTQTVSNSEV
jgi:membrane-bound serine protease (ClpP class)